MQLRLFKKKENKNKSQARRSESNLPTSARKEKLPTNSPAQRLQH
jgi:hypothetical protein